MLHPIKLFFHVALPHNRSGRFCCTGGPLPATCGGDALHPNGGPQGPQRPWTVYGGTRRLLSDARADPNGLWEAPLLNRARGRVPVWISGICSRVDWKISNRRGDLRGKICKNKNLVFSFADLTWPSLYNEFMDKCRWTGMKSSERLGTGSREPFGNTTIQCWKPLQTQRFPFF